MVSTIYNIGVLIIKCFKDILHILLILLLPSGTHFYFLRLNYCYTTLRVQLENWSLIYIYIYYTPTAISHLRTMIMAVCAQK